MRDSIHKYFQVGTIQWMSHPHREVLQSLRGLLSDDYFDAIEVCHFHEEATRAKAKELLEQSGARVCYGAQPILLAQGLNPNATREEERLKAERALLEALDEAQYLGAQGMAFLAGKWTADTQEEAYRQLLKTTRTLCQEAGKKGMMIELEVFDYDMDKAALIGPAPLAARFAGELRQTNSNFGLLVDLSHFPTTYETSWDVVRTLRPYITHLHFGNAVVQPGKEAYGDAHPRMGFPHSANGVQELLDFLTILKAEGFFRAQSPMVLSMEVKPWGDEDEDIILANTKRALNRAWAMLDD